MAVRVAWDDPGKTIIRCELSGQWGEADFRAGLQQLSQMIINLDYRVDGIFHITSASHLFMNINPITLSAHVGQTVPDKNGIIVIASENPLIQRLLKLLRQVFGGKTARLYAVTTLEEARALIAESRRSA